MDAKGVHRIIAYGGRLWSKHESMYSVSELEMAGILYAIESNSQYFLNSHFKIRTDHISNVWIKNLKRSQGRLYRWSLRIQNYNFDVEHVKGEIGLVEWWIKRTNKRLIWRTMVS